jgi:molecular chaperone HscB
MDAAMSALGRGFDEAGADGAKLSALLPRMGELRYIRRFLDEVSAFEEEMLV